MSRGLRAGPIRVRFITYQAKKLSVDIGNAADEAEPRLRDAVEDTAKDLKWQWRRNARKTARRHGKHYPKAISYDMYPGGMRAEVGPDALHPGGQGGMAFEYGGPYQPPHLDGNRALDDLEPVFRRRVAEAAEVDL